MPKADHREVGDQADLTTVISSMVLMARRLRSKLHRSFPETELRWSGLGRAATDPKVIRWVPMGRTLWCVPGARKHVLTLMK